MDERLREEYNNIREFLNVKYNLSMEESLEDMKHGKYKMVRSFLYFLISLKIWEEKMIIHPTLSEKSRIHFKENVSNMTHSFLLAMLQLKIPAIFMMRRTQENLLTFLYYNEHHIESEKKENDANYRPFKDFSGLKEYIKSYPFKQKYQLDAQKLRVLLSDIIEEWAKQYSELSNYVHGSNANYFSKQSLMDAVTMTSEDYILMAKNIAILSSMFNSLMMIFFFADYLSFDEDREKHFIRMAMANDSGWKKRILQIFNEI